MKMATVGKLGFGYLFFTAHVLFAKCDVQVKILNQAGVVVSEVSAGVPFQLHIIAKGDCDINEIKFSSDFEICKMSALGTIKSVSNVNRVINHTITHRYMARIDRVGSYVFGPIQLKNGNQVIENLNLTIHVRHETAPRPSAKNLMLECKASKQKVYVGERFVLRVRFYFNDLDIKSANLNFPADFKDMMDFELINSAISGSEMQNGYKIPYLQWDVALTARQAGELLLPAISVIFEKKERVNQFFIFQSHMQEELFSNALLLQVISLPPRDVHKEVDIAVGVFEKFTAEIDHTNLQEGQAAQLVLKLKGDGNWNKVNLQLTGVCDLLQSYAGSITLKQNCKKFEYVLQGVKKGKCFLPEQIFFYFDPIEASYKTLTTDRIEIDVLSVSSDTQSKAVEQKQRAEKQIDSRCEPDSRIKGLMENGSATYQSIYFLPVWIFVVLIFLPFSFLICIAIFNAYYYRSRSTFAIFQTSLLNIAKNKQGFLLYGLFTNILIQKFNLSAIEINSEKIEQLLMFYGVPTSIRKSFCIFYYELAAVAFAKQGERLDLFEQAQNWLNFLEGLVLPDAKKN